MFAALFLMKYLPSGPGIGWGSKTIAISLSGLRPGPSVGRNDIWPSSKGVSSSRKSAALTSAGLDSTLERHNFNEERVCGGVM